VRFAVLPKICYLGDDFLTGAAIYLAGIMTHFGLDYDYVPSAESPGEWFTADRYALYVISDYPAARFRAEQLAHLVRAVHDGSGLVMLGGWESFHGRLGEYHASPLADVLPVAMLAKDDRRNCAQPCLVERVAEHPILEGIPFETPPGIGGFNAFSPKPDATTLLTTVEFSVRRTASEFQFTPKRRSPLLVVGRYGQGRTAALACDVAPHWIGGMVDWGDRRVVVDVAGGFIDVGNWYAQFFHNLLQWTGQLAAR
jgi:uncharacterized membrane protein